MSLNPANKAMLPQDAKLLAQFIAMAPFVFQTALSLRDFGVLAQLCERPDGIPLEELLENTKLSSYSLRVLLDAGESSKILESENKVYRITETGRYLEKDSISRINMNFTQDVCYEGLFSLKESLETNTPAGLKVFGKWPTIYEGLSQLPEQVKKSWFEFDHFFSDDSFPRALPIVFKDNPKTLMDVGGNTGKFATACAEYSDSVLITLVDHPGQINVAETNIKEAGFSNRLRFHAANLLDHSKPLPEGHDVIWMSQLLSCFSEEDIVELLKRARKAMGPNSRLFIMENFPDQQKFEAATFCLNMTSLYFTAMANGNSRMHRRETFHKLLDQAGLKVVEEHPYIRLSHTILKCAIS